MLIGVSGFVVVVILLDLFSNIKLRLKSECNVVKNVKEYKGLQSANYGLKSVQTLHKQQHSR